MGKRKSLGRYRSKTRKFHGNQFTEPADQSEDSATKRVIETTSPSSADGITNDADLENDLSCSSAKNCDLALKVIRRNVIIIIYSCHSRFSRLW